MQTRRHIHIEPGVRPLVEVSRTHRSAVLPVRPSSEIMESRFEVPDYQDMISGASLENELMHAGYTPLSKIVVKTDAGDKRTQFIKGINRNGQKVFIEVDVHGYTTARTTDLTLIESHSVSIVPYSLKVGAFDCVSKEVSGVAFECGSDAVCVLKREGSNTTEPKESNFVFVEQHAPAAAILDEGPGSIMSYPVIRLSEIRANPELVVCNTDTVTRRLRNEAYKTLLAELVCAQQSIQHLNEAFVGFNCAREEYAGKLNCTLTTLEGYNRDYLKCPPTTDEAKEKFRLLQFNITQRNGGIETLLRCIKKIADKKAAIETLAHEIKELTEFCHREFATVEHANSE